jgi:hypothetical protein
MLTLALEDIQIELSENLCLISQFNNDPELIFSQTITNISWIKTQPDIKNNFKNILNLEVVFALIKISICGPAYNLTLNIPRQINESRTKAAHSYK